MIKWTSFWLGTSASDRISSQLGPARILFYASAAFVFKDVRFDHWLQFYPELWQPPFILSCIDIGNLTAATIDHLTLFWKISLIACAFGLGGRLSFLICALLATFLFGFRVGFDHSHQLNPLVLVFWIFAFSNAANSLSLKSIRAIGKFTAWFRRDTFEPWPIKLGWFVFSSLFFIAGVAKLRHSGMDWIDGQTLVHFINLNRHLDGSSASGLGLFIMGHPGISGLISVLVIGIELTAPLALFYQPSRPFILVLIALMQIFTYPILGVDFSAYVPLYALLIPSLLSRRKKELHALQDDPGSQK